MRRASVIVAAALVFALAASAHDRAAGDACSSADSLSTSWEAVFGHYSSEAAAREAQQRVIAKNFKNATIERDGCSDYEVEVPGGAGLDTTEQRQGFLVEARQVGFSVTFEAPCCYAGNDRKEHDWEAVFGHRPTLEAATALELRAIGVGYSHLVVERDGPSDYEVALPGGAGLATARGRASFAAEARTSSAHLSVVFERS